MRTEHSSFHAESHGPDRPDSASVLLLSEILKAVLQRWRMVAAAAFLTAAVAVAASFAVTPTYRATAVYAPVTENQQSIPSLLGGTANLASLAGISLGGGATLQRIGALTQARAISLEALRKEGALPALFPSRWDAQQKRWVKSSGLFTLEANQKSAEPTPQEITESFELKRVVEADNLTNLISVRVTLQDPELAARLANRLSYYVNEYERARAREEARASIDFLTRQLEMAEQATVRDTLRQQLSAALQKATLVNARKDYIVEVVDPAIVPERKIAPRRSMYLIFGLLLGGGSATILALYFRRREAARTRSRAASVEF